MDHLKDLPLECRKVLSSKAGNLFHELDASLVALAEVDNTRCLTRERENYTEGYQR